RRRPVEPAPAPDEAARRRRPTHPQAHERAGAEVTPALGARLLPEGLVALDHAPAGPGERQAEQAVRAVPGVVGAEQTRARRRAHGGARRARRSSGAGPWRSTPGPSPRRRPRPPP